MSFPFSLPFNSYYYMLSVPGSTVTVKLKSQRLTGPKVVGRIVSVIRADASIKDVGFFCRSCLSDDRVRTGLLITVAQVFPRNMIMISVALLFCVQDQNCRLLRLAATPGSHSSSKCNHEPAYPNQNSLWNPNAGRSTDILYPLN